MSHPVRDPEADLAEAQPVELPDDQGGAGCPVGIVVADDQHPVAALQEALQQFDPGLDPVQRGNRQQVAQAELKFVRRAYAALQEGGRPMRAEELIPPMIPDFDNAALLLERAMLCMKSVRVGYPNPNPPFDVEWVDPEEALSPPILLAPTTANV